MVMQPDGRSKGEVSVSAKLIKADGAEVDLGVISYAGPWYKVLVWKILRRWNKNVS